MRRNSAERWKTSFRISATVLIARIGRRRKLADDGASQKVVDFTVARNWGRLASNDIAPDVVTSAGTVEDTGHIAKLA